MSLKEDQEELKTGEKIVSKRNRLAIFDGHIQHKSVTQTDTKYRLNYNLNFLALIILLYYKFLMILAHKDLHRQQVLLKKLLQNCILFLYFLCLYISSRLLMNTLA